MIANTGNKSLDKAYVVIFFIAALLWFLQGYGVQTAPPSFNWLAFLFLWLGLGMLATTFVGQK